MKRSKSLRKRSVLALLALWMWAGPAAADDHDVVIRSFPPHASIAEGPTFLGKTGQPIRLDQNPHQLTLSLEGHQPVNISLTGPDVEAGIYPANGEIVLAPLSTAWAIRDELSYRRWRVALVVSVLLGGLYARSRWSSLRKRQDVLESLTGDGKSGELRSLIMEQVGGYRVISTLGQGGMAEVYQAVPNDTLNKDEAVAIKVLNREMRDRPDLVARFEREVLISEELTHPGIVQVRSWGWHQSRLYLVMELIEGQELRQLMPRLKGDKERLKNLLSQLMVAVDHAHQRGISHRDLKPENVMVTPGERVKVMDFGLARAMDSRTLTQAGSAMGTPRYIAPETVAGRGGDDLADQYTLGIMAFEMLTGRPPFDSDEVLHLLFCHGNVEPPAPSSLNPAVPASLDQAILRMLEKDPRERFRTVEDARVAVLEALEEM